jgi:hypothetical protein
MAYLGKISAVLAANTQDFTRGLREAGQELQRFQRQTSGIRLNLDSNALDRTLTNLQRFERTIQEIKRQIAANPEQRGLFPNPDQLQKQFRLFENVGKPLTAVKAQIEGLSHAMQAGLYPELGRIQAGFQRLYRTIGDGPALISALLARQKQLSSELSAAVDPQEIGRLSAELRGVESRLESVKRSSNFERQARSADSLAAAIQRLGRVTSAAADFGSLAKSLGAERTGASFYQPRAKEALQASLEMRGAAEKLPSGVRGGVFADLSVAAEENANAIERQVARILELESRLGTGRGGLSMQGAKAQAQQNLDRLTRQQEVINRQFAVELRGAEIRQIIAPGEEAPVRALSARFAELAGNLREASATRFEPVIRSVGMMVEQLNRGEASAERVRRELERLSNVDAAKNISGKYAKRADESLRTESERDVRDISRAASGERKSVIAGARKQYSDLAYERQGIASQIAGLSSDRDMIASGRMLLPGGEVPDASTMAQIEGQISALESKERALAGKMQMLFEGPPAAAPSASAPRQRQADEYIKRLDYRDVTGRPADVSPSMEKYAGALASRDAGQVDAMANHLRAEFKRAMSAVGMEPSKFGQSKSWANWDIGKQLFLNDNPNQSSSKYRLANPLEDKRLQEEIVARMVGWEMHGASGAGGRVPASNDLTASGMAALQRAGFSQRSATLPPEAPPADTRRPVVSPSGPVGPVLARRLDAIGFDERLQLDRESFGRNELQSFLDAKKTAKPLNDAGLSQRGEALRKELARIDSEMAAASKAGSAEDRAAGMDRYNKSLAAIGPVLQKYARDVQTASDANERFQKFLAISGSRSDKLGAELERAASDIAVARQFVGNFEGNLTGRGNASAGIESAIGKYEQITRDQQSILSRSASDFAGGEAEKRRAIAATTKAIREQRAAVVDLIHEESKREGGVGVPKEKIVAAMDRAAKNRGSFSMAGFASAQLAMQQGLFAIDDFMSATGGMEYKLRAIGNNITQLGLLLGQSGLIPGLSATAGLFVGLAAVMGGQALSAMMRWATGTENAELGIKAMNDSLARQKSLVESLAQAFRSLGESTLRGSYSEGGERDAGFRKQIEDIRQRQVDLRKERAAALDETVQKERVEQSKLAKRLEGTSDVGQRVALTMSIEQSRVREKEAADRALARASAGVSPDAIERTLLGTIRSSEFTEGGRVTLRSEERADVRARAASVAIAGAFGDPAKLEEIVRQRMDERRVVAQKDLGIMNLEENPEILRARDDVKALADLLSSIRDVVQRQKIDDASNEVASSSRDAAEEISRAHKEVARAIELGLPGARLFAIELDASATKLDEANRKLDRAASGKRADGTEITTTAEKAALVEAAKAEVASVSAERDRIQAQSDAYRRERVVDPQRQADARAGRASSNLGAAGLGEGRIARRMREIENERETLRQQSSRFSGDPMAQRLVQQSEAALSAEVAAIEAATIAIKVFADALNRASEEAKGNLNSAQQRADEARRADLGNSTPQTQEARRQAEADLERQRDLERQAQTEIAVERDRLDLMQQPDAKRIRQIDERLKGGMPFNREGLIREREEIRGRMDDAARASQGRIDAARDASTREAEQAKAGERGRELSRTPEERFKAESEKGLADIQAYFERRAEANNGLRPAGDVEAQAAAEERFRKDREREARTATAAGRGAELGMTPEQRFRRDFAEGAGADINARAAEMRAKGENPNALLRQAVANQMEAVAPMLKGFQDERQNALFQGPSRAALNVSDVSTSQGASELTRLIRGDDSAKDVNLAELRKQTQKFDDVIEAIRTANPGVLL